MVSRLWLVTLLLVAPPAFAQSERAHRRRINQATPGRIAQVREVLSGTARNYR